MENANHQMKMPMNYVDMSATEMEFDGGWSWKKFFVGVAIAGAVLCVGGAAVGLIGGAMLSTTLAAGGGIAMAAGLVLGLGGSAGIIATSETSK